MLTLLMGGMVTAIEEPVPFHCGLLMGQTDQTTGSPLSAAKIPRFRWFKEIRF